MGSPKVVLIGPAGTTVDEDLSARHPLSEVMAGAPGGTLIETGSLIALAGALALSVVVLARLDENQLVAPLRERFVFGVPWGTLLVLVGVSLVYYLLQGGGRPGGPVVTGFRSWSVWYPQGLVLSAFAHSSDAHLLGNLLGTVAFAPVAEYAWSHYPQGDDTRLSGPAGRIGAFVAATVVAGLASSLFVPGAVIGFSVVVFAFAGFALVVRPLTTVFAILGVQALGLVRRAVMNPLVTARARPVFVSPSWAEVALQGHLFGLLFGAILAVSLLQERNARPTLRHVWFAALVVAVTRSMYAVYWFLSADRFLLFRALGTAGIFVLATLLALAALPPDRSPRLRFPVNTLAIGLLVVALVALAVSGLAYNLVSVTPGESVDDGVAVGDYRVDYVEDADNRYISAVTVPGVGSPLSTTVSGVVVASDSRNAWEVTVPARRLAFEGSTTVVVGGTGFRETVRINRTAWRFPGGNSTYRVQARHDGEQHLLYAADPAVGAFRIDGTRVRIEPTAAFYSVSVERNGSTVRTARIPAHDESVRIEDITFERAGDTLFARHEDTRLAVAEYRVRRER